MGDAVVGDAVGVEVGTELGEIGAEVGPDVYVDVVDDRSSRLLFISSVIFVAGPSSVWPWQVKRTNDLYASAPFFICLNNDLFSLSSSSA